MKKTVSIILAFFLCLTLTSCSGGEREAVAVAYGSHAYSPALSSAVNQYVYNACRSYGSVSSFIIDGEPYHVATYNIAKPDKRYSKSAQNDMAAENASTILKRLAASYAVTPETDPLEGLKKAAAALNGTQCENKTLIMYDNGLATTGLLSEVMCDLNAVGAADVCAQLKELHALPDLHGINVVWLGMGCTTGKAQMKIPDSYRYRLEELWKAIITAAGGELTIDASLVQAVEIKSAELPPVTPILFESDVIDVAFDETTVKFKSDSNEFLDPAAAEKCLVPVANKLIKNNNLKITIAGTTANDGRGNGVQLSQERAGRCRDILVKYGAPASNIKILGLGCSDNILRVNDLDESGRLIEEMAVKNRAIHIFSDNSQTAKSLKI